MVLTTGEKIAKLRKEYNYTQESLGEELGVTRQAVSKWESDITFPETEKLILLSKLFNCNIDYLLNNNIEYIINNKTNNSKTIGNIFTIIWSSLVLYISLLLFILPFASTNNNFICYPYTDKNILNVYDILLTFNYDVGNYLILFGFISQIIMVILSILIVKYKKEVFYKIRYVCAIFEFVIWIVICALEIYSFQIGMALMILLSLTNVLGLSFISFNKYHINKEEPNRVYNSIIPIVIASIIFVLSIGCCFIDAVELAPDYDIYKLDHINIIELIYLYVTPPILIILSIVGITFEICVFILAILICVKKKKILYNFQVASAIICF